MKWNECVKAYMDSETRAIAEDCDIELECGGYLFLCQTRNGFNNIIMVKTRPETLIALITAVKMFFWYIYLKGVNCVRVEGSERRYGCIARFFPSAVRDYSVKGRNVYYINLEAEKWNR